MQNVPFCIGHALSKVADIGLQPSDAVIEGVIDLLP
jgi:hypothetical protein